MTDTHVVENRIVKSHIVGFVGRKGSGKDTAAHALIQNGYVRIAFADKLRDFCQLVFGLTEHQMLDREAKETAFDKLPVIDRQSFIALIDQGVKRLFGLTDQQVDPTHRDHLTPLQRWPHEPPQTIMRLFRRQMFDVFWPRRWEPITPRLILQLVGTEVARAVYSDIWITLWAQQAMEHDRVVVTDVRFLNEAEAIRHLGGTLIRITRPSLGDNTDLHASELEMAEIDTDVELINDQSIAELQFFTLQSVRIL